MTVPGDAFAFSPEPAWAVPWNPDTMTHRYRRYARRVGITSSLKELRHYSATQLLANGVDLNTVAGRLGHAEGSTTPGPVASQRPYCLHRGPRPASAARLARSLARVGAKITLAVRNIDAGVAAAADIAKPTGRDNVPVAALYLADRASVVSFVQSWHGPLHVLSMPEMLLLICMRPNGPRAA